MKLNLTDKEIETLRYCITITLQHMPPPAKLDDVMALCNHLTRSEKENVPDRPSNRDKIYRLVLELQSQLGGFYCCGAHFTGARYHAQGDVLQVYTRDKTWRTISHEMLFTDINGAQIRG